MRPPPPPPHPPPPHVPPPQGHHTPHPAPPMRTPVLCGPGGALLNGDAPAAARRVAGRNWLIPQGLAAYATPANKAKYLAGEVLDAADEATEADILRNKLSSYIESKTVVVKRQQGNTWEVNKQMISDQALKQVRGWACARLVWACVRERAHRRSVRCHAAWQASARTALAVAAVGACGRCCGKLVARTFLMRSAPPPANHPTPTARTRLPPPACGRRVAFAPRLACAQPRCCNGTGRSSWRSRRKGSCCRTR